MQSYSLSNMQADQVIEFPDVNSGSPAKRRHTTMCATQCQAQTDKYDILNFVGKKCSDDKKHAGS